MDLLKYVEIALLVVGAASVAAVGLDGAVTLIAPKTASEVDDKVATVLHKVVKALNWVKGILDTVALNLKK